MNYYIFRHGETIASKGISHYNDNQFTTGILPEGHAAIERLAEYLKRIKTDHNAASELLRVQETVEIVTRITGKIFVKDPRLNELLDKDNLEPPYPFTGYFEPKKQQLVEFLDEMKRSKFDTVAICTHGYNIAGLKHLITTENFEPEDVSDFPRPGILTIIKENIIEEIDFN